MPLAQDLLSCQIQVAKRHGQFMAIDKIAAGFRSLGGLKGKGCVSKKACLGKSFSGSPACPHSKGSSHSVGRLEQYLTGDVWRQREATEKGTPEHESAFRIWMMNVERARTQFALQNRTGSSM